MFNTWRASSNFPASVYLEVQKLTLPQLVAELHRNDTAAIVAAEEIGARLMDAREQDGKLTSADLSARCIFMSIASGCSIL